MEKLIRVFAAIIFVLAVIMFICIKKNITFDNNLPKVFGVAFAILFLGLVIGVIKYLKK